MKTKFLFPNYFNRIGWLTLIPSSILGLLDLFDLIEFKFLEVKVFAIYSSMFPGSDIILGFDKNNITNEIFGILSIIGALFVAFSKEKNEDEFIAKTRIESLVWGIYINYILLIFCILFFYDLGFLYVLIFNMYTILIFFIIRFNYMLYMSKKALGYEK